MKERAKHDDFYRAELTNGDRLMTKVSVCAGAVAALVVAAAVPARAAFVITYRQAGADVVATGIGSLALGGSRRYAYNIKVDTLVEPGSLALVLGAPGRQPVDELDDIFLGRSGNSQDYYRDYYFGGDQLSRPDAGSGGAFGFYGKSNKLFVPAGYVEGTLFTSSSTYSGQTLASMQLVPGSYGYSYTYYDRTSGTSRSDTITVNVEGVPEPASWVMMVVGFGILGVAARRRRQQHAAIA